MGYDSDLKPKWDKLDVLNVETIHARDGDNLLPATRMYADTPTWHFYERFIHILEGDLEFDFQDFTIEDLKIIDWLEIKIVIQKMKGEEPEDYDPNVSLNETINITNMQYVK